ncbi:MAG: hypothetical protein KC646_00525 [Candidatus Cloacimonetes bacterium]|nr:hypothetical protein [Candidatus Cloacimonadota bacterium]
MFKLIFLYSLLLCSVFAQDLTIPLNLSELIDKNSVNTRAVFPPPMDYYDHQIWILDTVNSKIKSLSDDKLNIDLSSFQKRFPVDDFKIVSYSKIFLMSKQKLSLASYDSLSKKLTIISKKSEKNDMFFEMSSLKKAADKIYVSDLVSGFIRIFSKHGFFLGSIKFSSEDFLPFSPVEVITLFSEGDVSSLGWASISGGKKVFYSEAKSDNDEFVTLSLVGMDQDKNTYVQKIYGSTHGLAKLAVQKISPKGDLISEKKVAMTLFEYQEFQRFFFVTPKAQVFQIKHNEKSDSLYLKSLDLILK